MPTGNDSPEPPVEKSQPMYPTGHDFVGSAALNTGTGPSLVASESPDEHAVDAANVDRATTAHANFTMLIEWQGFINPSG